MATKPRAESRSFSASSFHILGITAMLKIPREVTKGYIFFVFGFLSPPPISSFLTLPVCAVTKHLGTPALGAALSWRRKWKTSPPPYSSGSWTQKYLVYAVSWSPQRDWASVVQVRKKGPEDPFSVYSVALSPSLPHLLFLWSVILESPATKDQPSHGCLKADFLRQETRWTHKVPWLRGPRSGEPSCQSKEGCEGEHHPFPHWCLSPFSNLEGDKWRLNSKDPVSISAP